jgi:hypothetical protein
VLSFHLICQRLDQLRWDGTKRLDGWLKTYLGATGEDEYLKAIGSMFLDFDGRAGRGDSRAGEETGALSGQRLQALATRDRRGAREGGTFDERRDALRRGGCHQNDRIGRRPGPTGEGKIGLVARAPNFHARFSIQKFLEKF